MKKAFTLIELLIVVTVMATLMTIMLRIGMNSDSQTAMSTTVIRLQKLENCLSGYYAAFGCYPPVAIYGSRNIYTRVENGVQTDETEERLTWDNIDAACRSQPFDASFPFSDDADTVRMVRMHAEYCQEFSKNWGSAGRKFQSGFVPDFYGMVNNSEYWGNSSWKKVQIFRFGVMSYLLPRYLVMMTGQKEFYGAAGNTPCAQWSVNNDECISATTGRSVSWRDVAEYTRRIDYLSGQKNNGQMMDYAANRSQYIQVANMPTQAVCARWIGNLEGLCFTGNTRAASTVFGVSIKDESADMWNYGETWAPSQLKLYSPGGSGGSWYVLDTITVYDGWAKEFYYYSPIGSQSYTLWSAGANGKTFPPWADKEGLLDEIPFAGENDSREEATGLTIGAAIADDVVRMNH